MSVLQQASYSDTVLLQVVLVFILVLDPILLRFVLALTVLAVEDVLRGHDRLCVLHAVAVEVWGGQFHCKWGNCVAYSTVPICSI